MSSYRMRNSCPRSSATIRRAKDAFPSSSIGFHFSLLEQDNSVSSHGGYVNPASFQNFQPIDRDNNCIKKAWKGLVSCMRPLSCISCAREEPVAKNYLEEKENSDSEYDPRNLPFLTLVKEYLALEENKMHNKLNDVQRNQRNSFKNGDGRMLDLTLSIRGELDKLSVNSSDASSGKRIRKKKSHRSHSKQRVLYEVDLCGNNPPQKDLEEQNVNRDSSLRASDSLQSQIVKSRKRTGERRSKPRSIPLEETSHKKTGRISGKMISEDIAFTESPLENMRQESLASGKQHLKVRDQGEPNQMSKPNDSALTSRKSKPRKKANPESIRHEVKACLQSERKCGKMALENDDVNQSPKSTTRKKSVQVLVVHDEEDLKRIPRRLEPMPKQRKSRSEKKRRPASEKGLSKKKAPRQEISNPADVAGRQTMVEKSQSDISASMAAIPKIEQLGSCEYMRYPSPPRHKPNKETRRKVRYRTSGRGDNACLQQNGGSIKGIKYRSQSVPKDVHLSRGDLLKQSPSPQQVEPIVVHSLGSEMEYMQAKKEMRRKKMRKTSKVLKQDQHQVETVEQIDAKYISLNPSANSQQDMHTDPNIKSLVKGGTNKSSKKLKKRSKLPQQDQSHVDTVEQLVLKDVSVKSSGNAQQDQHTDSTIKLSVKDSPENSSPKKAKKRRKLPRQDLQNTEPLENIGLTYVSPKPCRNAPQAEPDQKLEDKACINDSSTKKIKDLQDFETLETQKMSEQTDKGLEGSDLILEEITQEMEASITELDRNSNDKVCVSDSSIKKVKSLTNLKTRDTQDTPTMVDKVLKDSELILEEITQEMETNPSDDLDLKSKEEVNIGNAAMKKIKNFPNLETRIAQEIPKPVDKVFKDSDLILEEITQVTGVNPSDELGQKSEQQVNIVDPPMKKIKNLPNFETCNTREPSKMDDKVSKDSDLILEEITQDLEENPGDELDQKSKLDVCIGNPPMKKIKNLPNFGTRNRQETPELVEKVLKDSDLIVEEFSQEMKPCLTIQSVVKLSANTKHYAITEFEPMEKLDQKQLRQIITSKKVDEQTETVSAIQASPHVQVVQESLPKETIPVEAIEQTAPASEPEKFDECYSWDLSDDEGEDLTKLPVAKAKKFGPKQDKADKKSKADVDDDNFSELLDSIEEKLLRKTQPKEHNPNSTLPIAQNPSTADSGVESQTGISNDVKNINAVMEEGCDNGNNDESSSVEQDASETDPFDISDILKSDDEPKTTKKSNPDSKDKALEKRDTKLDSHDSQKQRESDDEIPKGEATILGILEFQMKMKSACGLRLEKMQERYQELVDEYKEIVNKKKQPDKESLCSWSSAISKDTTTDADTDDQLSWSEPEQAKPITIQDIIDAKSKMRGRYCPVFERMETNCKTVYKSQSDLSLEGHAFENTASHKHVKENERKYESVSGKDLKKALKKALKKINHTKTAESLETKEEREFLKYQEKLEKKNQRRLKKMYREERKDGRRKVEEFLRAQDREDKKKMRVEQEIEKEKAKEQKKRERKERKERRKREKETKKELEEKREAEKERRERKERIEKAATRRRKEREKREKKESKVDEETESKHVEIQQSLRRMEKKLMRQQKRRSKVPVEWLGLTDDSRSKKKREGQNMKECFRPQDPNSTRRAWEWSKDLVPPSNTEVSCTAVEPLKVFEHGEFEERLIATIKTGIKLVIAKQMLYSQGRKYKKSYASKHSSRDYYHTRLNIDIPSNVLKCSERMKLYDFLKTCDKCKMGALKGWSMLWDYNAWFYPSIPGSTCKVVPDIDIKSAIKKTKLSIDEYAAVTAAKVMKGLHEATVT